MSDIPTTEELQVDEALLRRTITTALNPGPWRHCYATVKGCCPKCGREISNGIEFTRERDKPCPVPDEFAGSMADAALALVLRCDWEALMHASAMHYHRNKKLTPVSNPHPARWMFHMNPPIIQCLTCLLALDKARLGDE